MKCFPGFPLKSIRTVPRFFGDALAAGGSIDQTIEALETGGDVSGTLEGLEATINTFLGMQAQVGARQNRIELMTDRLKQQEVFATEILSKK
ncbi:hypothetical protein RCO48_13445 [Peribacillus frigoritolerans]|nr:hypothetical protein [Peribacillus frigoritolerans]